LVLIAAGVAFVVLAVSAVVVWRLMRRAARRMGGWQTRLIGLRAQFLSPGPRRDASRLRSRLHVEMRATSELLQAAPQGLIFRANAAGVLQELADAAVALDRELVAIERFLDARQQHAALATIAPQVEQLIQTTYTARQTVLRTAVEDRERQLAALRDTVESQAAALDTYRKNGRELSL
jgi:hypothetical protein